MRVAVVGAGAFGGWTALALLRRGAQVTLVEAWAPGHARSSSGGETRLIRTMYDGDPVYTQLAARALTLWRDAERQWNRPVLIRTGVLYLFEGEDAFARRSLPLLRHHGIAIETLSRGEAQRRFPQMDLSDVRTVYLERDGGVLLARSACELVRDAVEQEGGTYRQSCVIPPRIEGTLHAIELEHGASIEADAFVFACGPWLGSLFPDVIGDGILATRQEVIFFGIPPGDARFEPPALPAWINFGALRMYGTPAIGGRGLKVADDDVGPPTDPSALERIPSADAIDDARRFVRRRFPALATQPVLETRVCQYEYTPDADFLADRDPKADNVWFVGGGSGHGFKMGPALGEYVASLMVDGRATHRQFSYGHFAEGRARVRGTAARKLHS